MFDTRLTRSLGLAVPVVSAGMAMVARPALAAAVSNAGGLGTIACDVNPPEVLRTHVRETRALTTRPFGVDLIGDFLTDASGRPRRRGADRPEVPRPAATPARKRRR